MIKIDDLFLKKSSLKEDILSFLLILSVSWLSLVIINLFYGNLFYSDQSDKVPFIKDYAVNVRFLISFPVIFFSVKFVYALVGKSFHHFSESNIIKSDDKSKYESIVVSFYKYSESKKINFVLLIVAYISVIFFWGSESELKGVNTWKNVYDDGYRILPAGYCYLYISLPLFQYFLFKYIWIYLLWSIALFKISRLKLKITSSSPDGCGGLAFLGYTQVFFGFIGFSQNAILSSTIANKILYQNDSFENYRNLILLGVILFSVIYILPLIFFSKHMIKAKFKSLFLYSKLGLNYGSLFDQKWTNTGGVNLREPLLGTADIQSLADLYNSTQMVQNQLFVPLKLTTFIKFCLILISPYFPLFFLRFSTDELIKGVISFIF